MNVLQTDMVDKKRMEKDFRKREKNVKEETPTTRHNGIERIL